MLTENDIRQLLNQRSETKNLDYKEDLFWSKANKDDKLHIVKDILAMANTRDGGVILIGVRDNDFEFVGFPDDHLESIDATKINDLLHGYCDPEFSCVVSKHCIYDKNACAIEVPEFEAVPIICSKNANSSGNPNKLILRASDVYVRTDKATSERISSSAVMREFLGLATRKKGDEILRSVESLLSGRPLSPIDAVKQRIMHEREEADRFLDRQVGEYTKGKGFWRVSAFPNDFADNRMQNHQEITGLIAKSEVQLRGWNFPHTDRDNSSNFSEGRQSYTVWEQMVEGYRAYKSGYFRWMQVFPEDMTELDEDGRKMLSFVGVIYSVTEFFVFFKRFYEEIALGSSIHVSIALHGVEGRQLVSRNEMVFLRGVYIARDEPVKVERDISIAELSASNTEIANEVIRHIFLLFNWEGISEKVVRGWQDRLLQRRS